MKNLIHTSFWATKNWKPSNPLTRAEYSRIVYDRIAPVMDDEPIMMTTTKLANSTSVSPSKIHIVVMSDNFLHATCVHYVGMKTETV
jgi:hypothetical protein